MHSNLLPAVALGVTLGACGLGISGEGSGDAEHTLDAGPPTVASSPPQPSGSAPLDDAGSSGDAADAAPGDDADSAAPVTTSPAPVVPPAPPGADGDDGGDDPGGGPGKDDGGPGKGKGP